MKTSRAVLSLIIALVIVFACLQSQFSVIKINGWLTMVIEVAIIATIAVVTMIKITLIRW